MLRMAKRSDMKKLYVRPTPEARHALDVVRTAVSSPSLLGHVHQEDFVAATWLWLQTLDPATVADAIRPHVEVFQAFFAADPEPDEIPADSPGFDVTAARSGARKRKSR